MVPPKNSKGKGKIGESSNAPDSDPESFQPSLKQRRMIMSFRQCNLLLSMFGKIDTFPSSSFQFPAILEYQGVVDFISDSGCFIKIFLGNFMLILLFFQVVLLVLLLEILRLLCPWKMLVLVLMSHLKAKEFRMDLLPPLRVGKISTT